MKQQEVAMRIRAEATMIIDTGDDFYLEVQDADHGWRYRLLIDRVEGDGRSTREGL